LLRPQHLVVDLRDVEQNRRLHIEQQLAPGGDDRLSRGDVGDVAEAAEEVDVADDGRLEPLRGPADVAEPAAAGVGGAGVAAEAARATGADAGAAGANAGRGIPARPLLDRERRLEADRRQERGPPRGSC